MGFAARDFVVKFAVDFAARRATGPAGQTSHRWTAARGRDTTPVIKIKGAVADCRAWALRPQCTRSTSPRRAIPIRPANQDEALRAALTDRRVPIDNSEAERDLRMMRVK